MENEYGVCDLCGRTANLNRRYYHYDVVCTCHSPNHYEVVRHCSDCVPVEPATTRIQWPNNSFVWYNTKDLKQDTAFFRNAKIEQLKTYSNGPINDER